MTDKTKNSINKDLGGLGVGWLVREFFYVRLEELL
jgi:hypothetical protein